jgi:biotin-dependent carboxylase-like uncharacterized protein
VSSFTIVSAGLATTVQDLGRPGLAHLGVPGSGAVDPHELAALSRLVGNRSGAAGLETVGRLVVRANAPAVVATSIERVARSVGGGDLVTVEPAPGDLFGYLAVRGGVDVPAILGSRSYDSLSGLGPPPPADGDELAIGPDPGGELTAEPAPRRPRPGVVDVWPGPRLDWFADGALDELGATEWTVSHQVSRIGIRLDGPSLRRAVTEELPSEGLVRGAVQVPPDGRPVVMSADHPTTGGYPVVAVVDRGSLATVAQARPGGAVRMRVRRSSRPGP